MTEPPGNLLGYPVYLRIRNIQYAAHVLYGGTCGKRSERDYLGDVVRAVFFNDIIDYFSPALVTEVDVKVRHRHALGIQESFEEKVILHRINICDTDAIRNYTARSGASSGSHRDSLGLREAYEIKDYEVVIRIAHAVHDTELIVKSLFVLCEFIFRESGVSLLKACRGERAEILRVIPAVRHLKMRQLCDAEFKFHITAFCNECRVVYSLGH